MDGNIHVYMSGAAQASSVMVKCQLHLAMIAPRFQALACVCEWQQQLADLVPDCMPANAVICMPTNAVICMPTNGAHYHLMSL